MARVAISDVRDTPADELAQALGRLVDARAKLRGAEQAREQLASPETKRLDEEIAGLSHDIQRYKEEIRDEIDPEIKRITALDLDFQVKLKLAARQDERAATGEAAAVAREVGDPIARLLEMLPDEERLDVARSRVAIAADLPPAGKDPAAILADIAAQARKDAEPMLRNAEDSVRRGRSGYQGFVIDHVGLAPLTDPDDVTILSWCIMRERQLEEDELRQYRELFETARRQMEADLTEGLINRLSDKFQKAIAQITRLNRSLSGMRSPRRSPMRRAADCRCSTMIRWIRR